MINTGGQNYEVVLANQYFLRELVESIVLEDSLEEIAQRATVRLVMTPEFQKTGISPGQEIRISGVPFGGNEIEYLLHPGLVWDCSSSARGQKHLTVVIYDRAIYLAKSEDEYLFPAGETASQRLSRYASDWGIKLYNVPDTGMALAKAVYRARPIYSMIRDDLNKTVARGGDMFRPRMTPEGLELFKLGSNETVWVLESDQNIEEITQHRTMDGVVTKVKVLGNAPEGERSPVMAVVTGETDRYGTLQKVLTDSQLTDVGAAMSAARELLAEENETISVTCLDINTIRAGDKVQLNEMELLVTSVRHELGKPGRMSLELATAQSVRRRYFNGGSL